MKRLILLFCLLAATAFGALPSTTVWEVRQAGNALNGGGFDSAGGGGTDYSQQNSPQLTVTDASGSGTTTLTSVTGGFTTAMENNILQISGGTLTAGWYKIVTRTDTNNVVLDRTPGTGTLSTVNVGGALAAMGNIGSATAGLGMVAGNTMWVKAEATPYSRTTNSDTLACSGTSTLPITIIGYTSTRTGYGDAYLGRTNTNGPLITTNMPVYTYTTGVLTISGARILFEGVNLSGAGNTILVTLSGANSVMQWCKVANAGTGSGAEAIHMSGGWGVINCDASISNGGNAGAYAVAMVSGGGRLVGSRITSSAIGVALNTSTAVIAKNVILDCVGRGIATFGTGNEACIFDNTIVGGSTDAIDILSGTTSIYLIANNQITDNAGYGVDMNNVNVGVFLGYNRTRDNASGSYNSGTGWAAATSYGNVDSGSTGTTADDYVDYAGKDYRLIAASLSTSVAIPLSASIGALQRSQSGGGGGQTSSASAK